MTDREPDKQVVAILRRRFVDQLPATITREVEVIVKLTRTIIGIQAARCPTLTAAIPTRGQIRTRTLETATRTTIRTRMPVMALRIGYMGPLIEILMTTPRSGGGKGGLPMAGEGGRKRTAITYV
jgi:hypothetical protein